MRNTFAQHLELSAVQVEQLLALDLAGLVESPAFGCKLACLDIDLLRQSLPVARELLIQKLPAFYDWLQSELGVERVPDSPDHTARWVVGFLNNQESLHRLVELHSTVPAAALELSIPRLVGFFEVVEDEAIRKQWQAVLAALCLVLVVGARSRSTAPSAPCLCAETVPSP
ncbi:hypothetical protein [Gloeobacter violaceus]|nr:hypothetical protein [Gloeobacter violaceus]